MAEAYIFDHVRTPRGRGKKDGALHEVPSVRLAATALEAVRDRNGLDTSKLAPYGISVQDADDDSGDLIVTMPLTAVVNFLLILFVKFEPPGHQ